MFNQEEETTIIFITGGQEHPAAERIVVPASIVKKEGFEQVSSNLNPEAEDEVINAVEETYEMAEAIRGRIFGEDEILGGSNHSFETCADPQNCQSHREEYVRQNPPQTFIEKVKEGFHELKEKIFGLSSDEQTLKEESKTERIIEPEIQEEIPSSSISDRRGLPHTKPSLGDLDRENTRFLANPSLASLISETRRF